MQGIIKTRTNPAKAPYTILLAGETGVGKSSLLELIANVLHSKDIEVTLTMSSKSEDCREEHWR